MGQAKARNTSFEAGPTDRPGFVHLHLHTEYSLLDGGNQIDKLADRVAELGMRACAITDHGNLFGAVHFYEACRARNIKPILGVEAYVTPPGKPRTDRTYSGGGEGGFHLVLLAMNNKGWRNLLILCSEAYLTGFYYKPRIDRELLAKHSDGLIAINGHLGSEIGDHLLAFHRSDDRKHWDAAVESAEWHKRTFGGESSACSRFYIELQHHVPEQNAINPLLVRLARSLRLPLVCDNDAHFLREEDHDTHDTLICISTGKGKRDDARLRYPRDVFVKDPQRMHDIFGAPEYNDGEWAGAGREALENSVRIADACNVTLPLGENNAPLVRVVLPEAGTLPAHDDPKYSGDLTSWYKDFCSRFELRPFRNADGSPPGEHERTKAKRDCDAALRMLAEAGFVWRYGREAKGRGPQAHPDSHAAGHDDDHAAKVTRLERELSILADKDISAYFLIVWDFVNWGRDNGVPALARGSGVGTMVGYVLGLSNACPVKYGLLFERFTDPDRSEYPDIDIDLCQDGRGRVIEYVRQKYGHVAQIITFGTLKARAALRDVGRVLEIPIPEVDRICKLVPEALDMTLDKALEEEPELRRVRDSDPRYAELIEQARALEGHTRHAGVHAAGVIVATRPLHEIVPLYKQPASKDEDDTIITQWDGPTCEKMGLLKMDFLGLRTISVIERAKKLIRESMSEAEIWASVGRSREFERMNSRRTELVEGESPARLLASSPHHPLDLDRLTFDDPRVFAIFQRGETTGVFQFESGGMRRLLVEMRPDRLEDLIAANALFRPGPMELIPDYSRRKHGTEAVPSVHPIVDKFTRETYGVMVYQEQVMQIVHGLGGISLRDAYTLIKNISKKKHDKIEKERPRFIDGAVRQGLSKDRANDLFELILKFAGYGFNKSHSTGYAIVAYQTAYLKAFFPAQYMAAFLTYESQAQKASDWTPYLEDCRRTRIIDPASGRTIRVGIEVRPPDINLSQADFTVVGSPAHIRFGLKAIKGAGEKAIEAIMRERQRAGDFLSLHDFCERVPQQAINKAVLEALIKCGAFDSLHAREQRSAMVASIDQAMSAGARIWADRAAGQTALFCTTPASSDGSASADNQRHTHARAHSDAAPLAKVAPWTESETLAREKDALGFYVSSHPLDRWKFWTSVFANCDTQKLKEMQKDARVVLAAMVQSVRTLLVKSGRSAGQKMAIVTMEDTLGAVECVLFTDCYARYGHLAVAENVVFVLGRVDTARGEAQVVVDRLVPVDGVPLEGGRLRLFLDATKVNGDGPRVVSRVSELLRGRGDQAATAPAKSAVPSDARQNDTHGLTAQTPYPVDLVIATEDSVALLQADPTLRVRIEPGIVQELQGELGVGMLRVVGGMSFEKERERKPWKRAP